MCTQNKLKNIKINTTKETKRQEFIDNNQLKIHSTGTMSTICEFNVIYL